MSVTHQMLSATGRHAAVLTRKLEPRSREACFDVVAGCSPGERNVLAVTWDLSAPEFVDRWRAHADAAPARCGVIDVGSEPAERPTAHGDLSASEPSALDRIRAVPDAADLPAVRQAITAYLDAWDAATPTVVYLDAGGALLDSVPLPSVTAFLGRLRSTLAAADAVACAAFETEGRDERTLRPVAEAFDAVLELDADRSRPAEYPGGPSADELFDVLSTRRRRLALRHLLRVGDALRVEELAAGVAGTASDGAEVRERRERLLTGLRHVDLPKLEDAGLVTVSDRVVSATDAVAAVEPHLALTATADVR
ncbi:hypothetical protein G9464_13015 [Halostella sp. JP-L12]|uniref:DUF7504 family protein n=1 Tax=Halostella TaxID=1843185 RepID=UPI000EF76430|nr:MULTISPECIES: hypothetical protein [Halostella]NHN48506.1 hypothetical protein [Halostella sp. JP-L12]